MAKTLIERLTEAEAYTASELGGIPLKRVGDPEGSATLDVEVILVGLDSRDEIIAALRQAESLIG